MQPGKLQPGPAPPLPLRCLASDEFRPVPLQAPDRRALARTLARGAGAARALGVAPGAYFAGRTGTAAALLAINHEWGETFYEVPDAAAEDPEAAREAFASDAVVIDVQTHYVARERHASPSALAILDFIRSVAPERWRDLGDAAGLGLADYVRCIYLESETAVAVLTAAPGAGEHNILPNAEIAGTRQLLERLGGTGRLLHHAIVHPNLDGELEAMQNLRDRFAPVGWKVYTLYGNAAARAGARGWRLDDEATGLPFLARAEALGVRRVCAHKGLSFLSPSGSPADIGPAARAFPGLDLLVYHSGYETEGVEEGPYVEQGPCYGTDRLVRSLREAGLAPGGNVYAELGSTWFALLRRPRQAAHVLGKLLLAVGEDNLLWGTDSIWYGSPQPLIDAFRAFRIPEAWCERWGYPRLTPEIRAKVLGRNAARVYGLDLAAAGERARSDDLAWARKALAEARSRGTPRLD